MGAPAEQGPQGPLPGALMRVIDSGVFMVYDGSEWRWFETSDEADEFRKTLFPAAGP